MTAASEPLTSETVTARREEKLLRLMERASASSRFTFGERWLFGLGGSLVVAGFVVVVIGWVGASRTVLVSGQIPYLISGGLIGLGLVFVGAFLYFGHWVAVLVRESRERGAEDRDDLALVRRSLEDVSRSLTAIAQVLTAPDGAAAYRPAPSSLLAPPDGTAYRPAPTSPLAAAPPAARAAPPPTFTAPVARAGDETAPILVATPTGSMAHRPGCRVLAGKTDLRAVRVAGGHIEGGLQPCGMCRPLDPEPVP